MTRAVALVLAGAFCCIVPACRRTDEDKTSAAVRAPNDEAASGTGSAAPPSVPSGSANDGAKPLSADQSTAADQKMAPIAITPADVSDVVASAPADYELRIEAAAYYLQHGMQEAGVRDLQAAVKLRPASATALIALADAETLAGQTKQAVQTYQKALKLFPSNPLALRGLGQLLIRDSKFAEARRVLEEGLKSHPESSAIRIALGNLYVLLHQNTLAETVLEPAVREAPHDAAAHYLLALAYERDLHINAALREARAAVAEDPEMGEAWASVGTYEITLQHYPEARIALAKALRLAPREAQYYRLMGDAYAKDLSSPTNLQKGIDFYHKGLALDSKEFSTLVALSTALMNRDAPADRNEAESVLRRVVALHPDVPGPYYRLANLLREMGRGADARAALLRFEALEKKRSASSERRVRSSALDSVRPRKATLQTTRSGINPRGK